MVSLGGLIRSLQMLVVTREAIAIAAKLQPNPLEPAGAKQSGEILADARLVQHYAKPSVAEPVGPTLAGLRDPLGQSSPSDAGPVLAGAAKTAGGHGAASVGAAGAASPDEASGADAPQRLAADASAGPQSMALLDPMGSAAPSAAGERAGIIASYVLNAALIPGWPAVTPQGVELGAAAQVRNPAMSDEEAMTYLANMGAQQDLMDKLRKSLPKPPAARKLLIYLAIFFAALDSVLDAIAAELKSWRDEQQDRRERLDHNDAPLHTDGRRRLHLE